MKGGRLPKAKYIAKKQKSENYNSKDEKKQQRLDKRMRENEIMIGRDKRNAPLNYLVHNEKDYDAINNVCIPCHGFYEWYCECHGYYAWKCEYEKNKHKHKLTCHYANC